MRGVCQFDLSSFEFDNGAAEGESAGDTIWNYGGVVPKLHRFADRALPQPDRSAPKCRGHAMQTDWSQSSFARNGAFTD